MFLNFKIWCKKNPLHLEIFDWKQRTNGNRLSTYRNWYEMRGNVINKNIFYKLLHFQNFPCQISTYFSIEDKIK